NGGDIIVDSDRPLGRFAFEMIDLDFPVQGDVTFTNTPLGTSVTIDFADFEQGSGSPFEVQGVIFGDRTANRVISATAANLGLPFFDRVTFNMPDQSGAIGVICATVNQKFDLALVKRLDAGATPGPFTPGSTVTFELEVYNQGGEDAVDIVVSDYVPEGLSLAPASAPDWVTEVDTVRLRDSIDIVAGDSAVLSVSFVIDADFMGDSLTNRAEISYFDDDGNPSTEPPLDNDSTPGDNGNDDPEADTPDEYDDENPNAPGTEDDPNDEDDYDWEGIPVVQTFDLALIKQIDTLTTPGPFTFESTVAYNLHVTNQGALDATDVTVADYIPAGLTLVPSTDWSLDADTARLVNAFDLAAGDTMTLAISFTIDPDFSGEGITNTAEITTADNALGLPDEDSVPGDNGGDDPEVDTDDEDDDDGPNGNGNPDDPNDSDDFDLARVSLETVSLGSTIFLDNNNDGFQNGADTGIANVEVQLFEAVTETQVRTDATGSRVTNPADAATVVTDVDGNYLFDNLLPGDYYVVIPTAPAAAPLSSNNAGVAFTETDPDDNRDNDDEGIQLSRGASVSSDTITLTLGEEPVNGAVAGAETAQGAMQDDAFDGNGNMTLDFGFFAPVSVGDTAFVDLDGNGLQDVDDPGIGGVTVVLLDSNGDTATVDADGNTITGVATTDPDGSYLFDNLPPGSYSVVFDLSTADDADNYVFTTPNAGDDTDDSDNSIALSDSTAQSDPTPFLNSGEEDLTLDVGVRCNVSVTVADPFTICATQPIDLTVGATVTPDTTTTFGATWTTPDGTGDFVDADGNVITTEPYRFGTAVAYLPSAADARRGEVTLVLTTDDPTGPCEPVSASVIIQVLKVDCGEFMWDGTND
ncbi:MAG: SdrD B-like domain-containing protein, partial [Bacteroidota bacterium]